MGCCSSREEASAAAGDTSVSPAVRSARLQRNHNSQSQTGISQTPLSQSTQQIHSTTASRAHLNPTSATSLPSASAVSSPRPSSNRHGHRNTSDATPSNLSDHYNLPLQRPRPWKSQSRTWSPSQLRRERHDFFDTRVTGQREVWQGLRHVTECIQEGDTTTAQGIVDAMNLTLPTGQLEDGCYDERGYLYKLPIEVLSNPMNLHPDEPEVDGETVVEVPADAKAKLSADALVVQTEPTLNTVLEKQDILSNEKTKDGVPEDAVHLKCRMSDRGTDINTYISKTETVTALASRLGALAQIPAYARIEVFYLGKKMDQKKTLMDQEYVEKHVLNIFVVGAPR